MSEEKRVYHCINNAVVVNRMRTSMRKHGEFVDYGMGLDLGNGSVGWVAMDDKYRLKRAKGKELIGARLFNSADTAANRRGFRTTRRRLSRRRWRLRMLDSLFDAELSSIDPNFLARRKYSWVHPEDEHNADKNYGGIIFSTKKQDKQFFKDYPTIYHLRKKLMEDTSQHDIREVYLAIHHIMKFRGNFLTENELSADSLVNEEKLISTINAIVVSILDIDDDSVEIFSIKGGQSLLDLLIDDTKNRSARVEEALKWVEFDGQYEKNGTNILEAILKALVGNEANLIKILGLKVTDNAVVKTLKINFSSANYEREFHDAVDSGELNDNQVFLIEKLYRLYQGLVVKRLLGNHTDLSSSQIASYEKHKKNLEFFRNFLFVDGYANEVDFFISAKKNAKEGEGEKTAKEAFYTIYKNINSAKDETRKNARNEFEKIIEAIPDEAKKIQFTNELEEGHLFPLQRWNENGAIPNQLHLNELRKIITNQGKYYPFLLDSYEVDGKTVNKLEGLLKFRVPYYVGPLVSPDDMNESDNNENHWMIRKEDATGAITPWNFDQMVDRVESGATFIKRLTGTDTYLIGEPTLPKHSLLYEKYMVLSELNNVRMAGRTGNHFDDRARERLSYRDKQILIDELFKDKKTVTKKAAENCLMRHNDAKNITLFGLSDEEKFVSSMGSYIQLSEIFGRAFVDNPKNEELLEQIIELQTVFEDPESLRRQLSRLDDLTDEQRKKLNAIHYTGWGKLSRKLLTTPCARFRLKENNEVMAVEHSIISIMEGSSKNLIEIISDKEIGVGEWIDRQNLDREDSTDSEEQLKKLINDLAISPKAKRGVFQAVRVVDDVAKALGNPPKRVFIEVADEVQESRRTSSRKAYLDQLYENLSKDSSLKKEFSDIIKEFKKATKGTLKDTLKDDRLFLYYIQLGKDMYSGKELNLERLSQDYDIDHIIPRAVTKDDSIENRVLVSRSRNARKSDSTMYRQELIDRMLPFWSVLHKNKLISDKKFRLLTRNRDYSGKEISRFVNRSLVETRQIMKNVSTVLRAYYGEDLEVYTLNSEITRDMRRYLGYSHKNRDINDYHHAQDALCIAAAGQFIVNRKFMSQGNVSDGASNSYNIFLNDYLRAKRQEALQKAEESGKTRPVRAFGFVVGAMRSENDELRTNPSTGEIVWDESDADYLRKVMNFKKMLVTQRVGGVKMGALYDEIRYGHDGKAKKLIAFDKLRKKVDLYGGFTSAKTASMMLIEYNGKTRLVSVTQSEKSAMKLDKAKAIDSILEERNFTGARIILDEVVPGQLLNYSGARVTVQSASEINNAIQLWLPQELYVMTDIVLGSSNEEVCANRLTEVMNDSEEIDIRSILSEIFEVLMEVTNKYYPLLNLPNEAKESFDSIVPDSDSEKQQTEFELKQKVILGVIKGLQANSKRGDLSLIKLPAERGRLNKEIKLPAEWGRLNKKSGYILSDSDEFIFQSPSGIFEMRITVSELKRRAGIE